jgi:hypothetical protein
LQQPAQRYLQRPRNRHQLQQIDIRIAVLDPDDPRLRQPAAASQLDASQAKPYSPLPHGCTQGAHEYSC